MNIDIAMAFKILFVTATSLEGDTLKKINEIFTVPEVHGKFEIIPLVTGVGAISTLWTMKQWIMDNGKPDLAINAGIAGSYSDKFPKGEVVMPVTDCFADMGIEDDVSFLTLSEAGLMGADEFPFKNGLLHVDNEYTDKIKAFLKPVRAITVNSATGSETTKGILLKKFNPDIETMEGATFFYLCSREKIPFLALRAISNMVERRNKNNWDIDLALNNLSEKLIAVLLTLE
jgi:futalosine hydrolase